MNFFKSNDPNKRFDNPSNLDVIPTYNTSSKLEFSGQFFIYILYSNFKFSFTNWKLRQI